MPPLVEVGDKTRIEVATARCAAAREQLVSGRSRLEESMAAYREAQERMKAAVDRAVSAPTRPMLRLIRGGKEEA